MADNRYEDVRPLIKTGDMLAWRDHTGGGLRSVVERWWVRHGTAHPHVHVGMAWVADAGQSVWVMDLTTKGCAPRLLSTCGDFDWAPAPRPLSDKALRFAQECFGEWTYSKWQAVLGGLKRLVIGADTVGQCAEYCLAIWMVDDMEPTDTATPGACVTGAMAVWGSRLMTVRNPGAQQTTERTAHA
ncbi:MAG: hypothetical protein V4706_01670 [Pseudomonadota bacterium]